MGCLSPKSSLGKALDASSPRAYISPGSEAFLLQPANEPQWAAGSWEKRVCRDSGTGQGKAALDFLTLSLNGCLSSAMLSADCWGYRDKWHSKTTSSTETYTVNPSSGPLWGLSRCCQREGQVEGVIISDVNSASLTVVLVPWSPTSSNSDFTAS